MVIRGQPYHYTHDAAIEGAQCMDFADCNRPIRLRSILPSITVGICKTPWTCTDRRKVFIATAYEKPFSSDENAKSFLAAGACPGCFAILQLCLLAPGNAPQASWANDLEFTIC